MMWLHTFRTEMQNDSMMCGVACLSMICRQYGKDYSQEYLTNLCVPTTEGVSLLSISDASELLGFHTISGRMAIADLQGATLPCILHWNQNHFVVLYKVKRNRYYIADPAKGKIVYSKEEFASHWISTQSGGLEKGVAMLLEPTPKFYEHDTLTQEERRSFRFLFGYFRVYRHLFLQVFLGLLTGSLIQLVLPFLTQSIVDVGIKNQDIDFIWLVLLGQLMLTFSRTALDFIRRWLLLHISMRINISLVSDFFIKLLKLPMSFFDTKLMGDLMQRMNDHGRVQDFLTSQSLTMLFSIMSFVVFGVVLFFYDTFIFSVFFFFSLLYGGWIALFLSRRKVLDYELFEKQAENNNKTYQFITTMQEIKLQDCEQRRRWEWEDVQADLFHVKMKSLKLQQTQEAGSVLINEVKNILITVLSATAVIHGDMTLGMMLAVQYIIGQLNSPVEQLIAFLYSVQDVKISLERINEIHTQNNEEDSNRKIIIHKDMSQGIIFSGACFKYDKHNPHYTLENINIKIPQGKLTAIVGASGSGKTTLVKLLLGFYPLNEGELQIGGNDIRNINLRWWRRQCGVVMQDGVIFSESIARNIAVDDNKIDVERLEKAAEIACIKDDIMRLPLRFNTKVGRDGVGLSQGQKQRLLIARAVYRNPDFILLDEATNALDAKNERAIVRNLDLFYQGKTVIVVAHRLSTVRHADQIIVIDKGKVIETGNHETLIAERGAYYQLVKNQLELGN